MNTTGYKLDEKIDGKFIVDDATFFFATWTTDKKQGANNFSISIEQADTNLFQLKYEIKRREYVENFVSLNDAMQRADAVVSSL